MVGMIWTDKMVAELKRLRDDGHSAAKIAIHFEQTTGRVLSRSAVLGKIHRLGWGEAPAKAKRPPAKVTTPPPGRPAKAKPSPIDQKRAVEAVAPILPAPLPAPRLLPAIPEATADRGIGILELSDHVCRFPITDARPFLFCGGPADPRGGPYCPGHARRSAMKVKV